MMLAALPVAALAGAAMLSAQSFDEPAPERSVEVNGWIVEDSAAPNEYDPHARVIGMRRGDDFNGLRFTVELSGDNLDGWGHNTFEARGVHDSQSCWRSGAVMAETGPPGERAGRVRAVLARELGRLERECRGPAGSMAGQLDGFEGGFALLSAWYGERQAEVRIAAYETYGNEVVYYDDEYDEEAMRNAAEAAIEAAAAAADAALDIDANTLDDYPPE